MSQKKRVRIYKVGGQQGQYINPTAKWMMQMGGQEQGQDEQIMIAVQQAILQGAEPNDVYDNLVGQGLPGNKVGQIVQLVLDNIDNLEEEAYVEESGDQEAAIELAQREAEEMQAQSQNQFNDMMQGAPSVNDMIMEDDDDYDDSEFEDDLYDLQKGGIPKRDDFIKQVKKQYGGKVKQGQKPEDVSSEQVFNFLDKVKQSNEQALLDKQLEQQAAEYYDNVMLPEAQRGREVRRANRQQRQLNRGVNKIMRNTPVGFMGPGMLPQNIGVINPFGMPQTMPQGNMQGFPGLQMANIEVHKTGLFGRPKQYSMTFNYNNPNSIKEAADVATSTAQSITDDEARKQQEGKPSNKEAAQELEKEIDAVVSENTKQKTGSDKKKSDKTKEEVNLENTESSQESAYVRDNPLLNPKYWNNKTESNNFDQIDAFIKENNTYRYPQLGYHLDHIKTPEVSDRPKIITEAPLHDNIDYIGTAGNNAEWTFEDYQKNKSSSQIQGEFINPFLIDPLRTFLYGGDLPKAQGGDAGSEPPQWFKDWQKSQQAQQSQRQYYSQQYPGYGGGMQYPYGTGYGNIPTMFNPYGRRPVIQRNPNAWMQQRGLATDAQGNPVTNPQALPLTRFAVTKSGLFGKPRRWEAEFGNYNQNAAQSQRPEKVVTQQDLDASSAISTEGQDNYQPSSFGEKLMLSNNRLLSRIGSKMTPIGDNTPSPKESNVGDIDSLPLRTYGTDDLYTNKDLKIPFTGNVDQLPVRPYTNTGMYTSNDLRIVSPNFESLRNTDPEYIFPEVETPQLFGLDLLSDGLAPTDFGDLIDYNEEAPFMPEMIDSTENTKKPKNQQQVKKEAVSRKPVAKQSYQWGSTNPNQQAFVEIQKLKDDLNFNRDLTGSELREVMKDNITRYANENNIDPKQFETFKNLPFSKKLELIKTSKKKNKKDLQEILIYLAEADQPKSLQRAQVGLNNTPLYTTNPFEEEDQAILNAGRRNDYGQVIIPDYNQQPSMQTEQGFSDYYSPEESINRAADMIGTGQGTAEIMPQETPGYKTKGKFKNQFDVDFGAAWDMANYGARTVLGNLSEEEKKRQHYARMMGMQTGVDSVNRFRGNYATNQVAAAPNFRDPQAGQMMYSQQGGQFNIGDEVEMTDDEIAKFVAGGGKLRYV